MKVERIFHDRTEIPDGAIIEMVIWAVPESVTGSVHRLKYSLFYGYPGQRLIGYDNEHGKDDHRHVNGCEEAYVFTTPQALIADFLADLRRVRGER
ncbi:MAG: DUF6516 family protein [Phaeospirillum sp.]|nr:DUF6516 family protein [Phaeospirillum sp.]